MLPSKKWMLLVLAALMIVAVALPATAAITQFTDVPDTNIFANDIQWMADNNVTKGCNSGGTLFCPQDNVTREQMSAFMKRLATGGAVDAGTLDGIDSTGFLTPGDLAAASLDADTLDGIDSTDFLGATDKATDSDKLDGLNSTDFLGATDKATDSDKLDGKDSTAFDTFIVSDSTGDSDWSTPLVTIDATGTTLAEATFSVAVPSSAGLFGSVQLEHASSTYWDIELWIQLDDTTCDGPADALPGAWTAASVAPQGTEPYFNSASIVSGVGLSSGAHTLTLCAVEDGGGTGEINQAGLTAVVSPSSSSVVSAALADTPGTGIVTGR